MKTLSDRICKNCGKLFSPAFGRQIFCSESCRKDQSNAKRRAQRIIESVRNTSAHNETLLSDKLNLSISEAAIFLGVSRPTIYKRIKEGEYTPIRISTKTIRIPKEQLLISTQIRSTPKRKCDFSLPIGITEALSRYDVTRTAFFKILQQEGIQSRIIKRTAYYPQKDLDKILPRRPALNKNDWYTIQELIEKTGFSRKNINAICIKADIPRRKTDGILYISKLWDKHRHSKEELSEKYMTRREAIKHYRIGNEKFYNFIAEAGIPRHKDGNFVYFRKSDLDKLFAKS